MARKPTRREFLGTGITLASGVLALTLVPDNSQATIESATFSIPDKTATLADSEIQDITLATSVETQINSNAPIHTLEMSLAIGYSPDSATVIATAEETDMAQTDVTIPFSLSGSVFSANDFSQGDFSPNSGEIRTGITAVLELTAYRNGSSVATDTVTERAEVAVSDEELDVTLSVDATGDIQVKTD